jgi:hypothetical protein
VHDGRDHVSRAESDAAHEAYVALRNHIADLMVAKGFLDPEGKADLSVFKRYVDDEELRSRILERARATGFLPEGPITDLR